MTFTKIRLQAIDRDRCRHFNPTRHRNSAKSTPHIRHIPQRPVALLPIHVRACEYRYRAIYIVVYDHVTLAVALAMKAADVLCESSLGERRTESCLQQARCCSRGTEAIEKAGMQRTEARQRSMRCSWRRGEPVVRKGQQNPFAQVELGRIAEAC